MAEPKTRATETDVNTFIETIADPDQRADAEQLVEMLMDITRHPPVMWGDSIVGFDTYSVGYADGSQRDWPAIGFSPRKGKTTIYCMDGDHTEDLAKLGRHSTSRSCLYVKRLGDVDEAVLKRIMKRSYATTTAGDCRRRRELIAATKRHPAGS